MINICNFCHNEFEHIRIKKYCCMKCQNKAMWANAEYKKKMSDIKKSQWQDPVWRESTSAKISDTVSDMWQNNEEYKEKTIEKNKERFADPVYLQKMKNSWTPERKHKMSLFFKSLWEDEMFVAHMKQLFTAERRLKCSNNLKELWTNTEYSVFKHDSLVRRWEDPMYRKMMSDISKEHMNTAERKLIMRESLQTYWTDENKEKQANRFSSLWNNDSMREQMINKMYEYWANADAIDNRIKHSHSYKEYEMPSGRIVKLQGYEPQVLTELLKTYSEDDIVIGVKEMNNAIGRVNYTFNNRLRTYYPDFYIKSTNTIIEVKSKFTYNMQIEKNTAKEHACLQLGFNFEFVIL